MSQNAQACYSALDSARVCLEKLGSEEGCDMIWLVLLKQCLGLSTGVSYESLGITQAQVEKLRVEICLKHIKMWRQVINPDHPDSAMVGRLQHWISQVPAECLPPVTPTVSNP